MKSFGPPSPPRSPDYSTAIRGPILTDHRIDYYARLGCYGEARRVASEARYVEAKTRKPRVSSLDEAISLLDL